jgi:type III secretion system YscD/HrpQ family protein
MAGPAGENILKVLSGNQYGVEVALPDGTYSFGSGAEADIQLLDVSLAPLHGQIRLRDGKVEVRTTGGELSTASGLVLGKDSDEWHEIAQMDAVSAAMSKFVVGGPGANWTSLSAPVAPRPAPAKGLGGVAGAVRAVPRRVLVAVGAGVAVVLLVTMLTGGGGDATQRGPEDARSAVADLKRAVEAMPFAGDVTVVERADGTLAVEGYVEEQVERRAIQNAMDASGLAGTLQVFVRSNLRADIEGTIDSMQVPAAFELDAKGNLTLTGTVLDPAKAEKLVSNIETGVFGLASVRSEIRTAEQIVDDLRVISDQAGLEGLVIFRLDGLVVEATGIVPRDKMDNWAGLIGVYSRRFAQDLPLRSFVTLDQPAATDTAPIIFGSGPVAEAEQGRVVAPESLTEPSEVDARSLFAGQPAGSPTATPQDPLLDRLIAALAQLRELRPELYRSIEADVKAGQVPDVTQLQEAMRLLGGSLRNTGRLVEGRPEVVVETANFGTLGTLEELQQRLPDVMGVEAAAGETPAEPAMALPLAPPSALPLDDVAVVEPGPVAEEVAVPAVVEEDVAIAPAEAITVSEPAPVLQAEAAVPAAPVAPTATPTSPVVVTPVETQPEVQTVTAPNEAAPDGMTTAAAAGGQPLPYYALPQGEVLSLGQIMKAAAQVVGQDEASSEAQVSPDLRALVGMQQEQLQMGRTLIRLPQPLSALPTSDEKPVTCWEGSAVQPAALPMTLLVLDVMSVSSEMDLSRTDPQLRDALMEVALSPQRVRACLAKTGSPYAAMVSASSAFLAEIDRNPSFAEFLFRNVPKAEVPVVGVNLSGDRYVELRDGRKLREGSAPNIASRITTIGDTGILVRTAEGTQVQLFGDRMGWRVVDVCDPVACGVN